MTKIAKKEITNIEVCKMMLNRLFFIIFLFNKLSKENPNNLYKTKSVGVANLWEGISDVTNYGSLKVKCSLKSSNCFISDILLEE